MNSAKFEISFGFLMHDVARLLGRQFDERARAMGLSRAQCRALAYLTRNQGINQAGLAELMEIQPISLARLLDRMEAAGWVERRPDPADRRARRLYLTDKAWPHFEQIRLIAAHNNAEAMAGLTAEQSANLIGMLRQVHANLSRRVPMTADAAPADAE